MDSRGLQLRRHLASGVLGSHHVTGGDRHRHHQRVLPHCSTHGNDRCGLRLRVERTVHPRARCVGPASGGGIPRHSLREADATHQGIHRGVSRRVEAREGTCLRRTDRQGAVTGRTGHGLGKTTEAHQSSRARRHSGVVGVAQGPERRSHRRACRRLVASVLRARQVSTSVGCGIEKGRSQAIVITEEAGNFCRWTPGHRRVVGG